MKAKKILIVEDDAFSRGVMEKLLQSSGYETRSFADAEEALTCLDRESFNILITDLHMPGMDGFELIRNARTIQPGLHAIMITGFSTEEVKCKAKQEKLDGFFSKPVDWNELYALLDILSGSGDIQELDRSSNTRRGKGLFLPAGIALVLILFILTSFSVHPSKAQPSFYPQNQPTLSRDSQDTCWKSPDLALTEAQVKAIEKLRCAYSAEVLPLVREIRTLVLELRYLVSDTKAKPQALIDRQRKISSLRAEIEALSFTYQVNARSIFTKEQLDRLPQDCSLGLSTGYEMVISIGRGPRRVPR